MWATTYSAPLEDLKMKKTGFLITVVIIIFLCCTACGDKAPELSYVNTDDTVNGDTFNSAAVEGYLSCTINDVRWSDNVKSFGIAPSELESYDGVSYTDNGNFVHFSWPEYVDLTTGQLADNLLFVLVDLTMTNIDALGKPIPENDDGNRDDSWYSFMVQQISICDVSEKENDSFRNYNAIWYAGTGNYNAAAMGTNGNNYFILRPGESLTYQMGFIIGSDDGDFSQMCITDGGGSYYANEANYVRLNISSNN